MDEFTAVDIVADGLLLDSDVVNMVMQPCHLSTCMYFDIKKYYTLVYNIVITFYLRVKAPTIDDTILTMTRVDMFLPHKYQVTITCKYESLNVNTFNNFKNVYKLNMQSGPPIEHKLTNTNDTDNTIITYEGHNIFDQFESNNSACKIFKLEMFTKDAGGNLVPYSGSFA